MRKLLFFIPILLLACSRNQEEPTKIKFVAPARISSAQLELQAINPVRTFGWGRDNVTSLSQVDCYLVAIDIPGKNDNKCSSESEVVVLKPSLIAGMVEPGQIVSLEVPPGPGRQITVMGFNKAPSVSCVDFRSNQFSRSNFSAPIILAQTSKDLNAGAEVNVEMFLNMNGSSNVQLCEGPDFPSSWFVPTLSTKNSVVTVQSPILSSGANVLVTLTTKDSLNQAILTGGESVTFSLVGGVSQGTFGAVTDHGDGTYSALLTGTAAGSAATIQASINGQAVTSILPAVTVVPGAIDISNTVVTAASTSVLSGENLTLTAVTKDTYGNQLISGGANLVFSRSGGTSTGTFGSVTDLANGQYQVIFTGQVAGTATQVNVSVNSTPLVGGLPSITVNPGIPALSYLAGPVSVDDGDCSATPYNLTLKDLNYNLTTANVNLSLSLAGGAKFYSDSGCVNEISSLSVASGSGGGSFYLKHNKAEAISLTASSGSPAITGQAFAVNINASMAHLGGALSVHWWQAILNPWAGTSIDGGFWNPTAVTHDSVGNMYVADTGNLRIIKLDPAGNFLGWVGTIKISPTGGAAGCSGATVGTVTPGWCLGGRAGNAANIFVPGDLQNVAGLTNDGTHLYVANGSRIERYSLSTGALTGWIGKVGLTIPTGGDSGCTGVSANTPTPGWCLGGVSSSGSNDGMMNVVTGVWVQGGYLYYVDSSEDRLARFDLTAKTFAGWIGKIGTLSPALTGTCSGQTIGDITAAGWCTGGTAVAESTGIGSGGFSVPTSITGDGSTYLYIGNNGRIVRYNVNGTYEGWIGWVTSTAPTGGAAGCTSTTNAFTPGWCLGGSFSANSNGQGGMTLVTGIQSDGTNLYVVDRNSARVSKYALSTGVFAGSIGRAVASPTGGVTGCPGTAPLASMPGWCTGAYTYVGSQVGAFNFKILNAGISFYSGSLYVADSGNQRLVRVNSSTGAILGMSGATLMMPQAWMKSTSAGAIESSAEFAFSVGGLSSLPADILVMPDDTLLVTDAVNYAIKKISTYTGVFLGWRGLVDQAPTGGAAGCSSTIYNEPAPGFCLGGNPLASGNAVQASFPGVVGLAADSNYYYSLDSSYGRIQRFDKTTHQFAGWIGKIQSASPALTAGCAGQSAGEFTNGWCIGGVPAAGGPNEPLFSAKALLLESGFFYVAGGGGRIHKFNATNGVHIGWTGMVGGTAPTGGDANCTSTTNAPTPGWCLGGVSLTGNDSGKIGAAAYSLASDGTYLYVSDVAKVSRYSLSTGLFGGWIGKIQSTTPPLSAGCVSQSANQMTNGWCTGGVASAAAVPTPEGSFGQPMGLAIEGGDLYVTDAGSGKNSIQKYNATTGAYAGWKGTIGSNAGLSGGAGCSTAAVGSFTPNWCTGGSPASNAGFATMGFLKPTAIEVLGSYLYVLDSGNGRLVRVPK